MNGVSCADVSAPARAESKDTATRRTGDAAKVEVKSTIRNGVCEGTVDGKKVYSGPGPKVRSTVSVRSESIDGKKTTRRFAEVYVDDRLVYKAGEAILDPDPKRNKDDSREREGGSARMERRHDSSYRSLRACSANSASFCSAINGVN